MDEIISENRSSKSVWMVAVMAVILFVAVTALVGSFSATEAVSVATN